MDIEQELRTHLTETAPRPELVQTIPADRSLVSSGILDSLGMLNLSLFIEERFQLNVPKEDLVSANFGTINRIVSYVQRLSSKEYIP